MKNLINWITSKDASAKTAVPASIGLLALRIGVGAMMAFGHGWGKLTAYGEMSAEFVDPFGFGASFTLGLVVFAEFFCTIALILGFFTRAAVIPLIINMTVAALLIHADDPFSTKEPALMYLTPFIAILFTGPGRYSLDRLLSRN